MNNECFSRSNKQATNQNKYSNTDILKCLRNVSCLSPEFMSSLCPVLFSCEICYLKHVELRNAEPSLKQAAVAPFPSIKVVTVEPASLATRMQRVSSSIGMIKYQNRNCRNELQLHMILTFEYLLSEMHVHQSSVETETNQKMVYLRTTTSRILSAAWFEFLED